MLPEFKRNDTVLCILNLRQERTYCSPQLGKCYTVTRVEDESWLRVLDHGIDDYPYLSDDFINITHLNPVWIRFLQSWNKK